MLARIKIYAIGAAFLVALVGVVLAGWRWHLIDIERTRAAAEAARDFKATVERIGYADVSSGDDGDDLRWLDDRLRARSGK